MKKSSLLFIPIVLSAIPLTGCKDYKFDNPAAVIRNRSNKKDGVMLVYGYESKADSLGTAHIRDFNNVVISNLEKATFKEGIIGASGRSIQFSLTSYYSNQSQGGANFTLYEGGYITYDYPYWKDGKAKVSTFYFNFEPEIAKTIVEQVYEEFDIAKVEEERFISTVTLENYFKVMEANKTVFELRGESPNEVLRYYDDGAVLNEMKKLNYIPFTEQSERINRGYWDFEYYNYPNTLTNAVAFEGGVSSWDLIIGKGETSRWAYMSFRGYDCYDKMYSLHKAYNLDIEEEEAFVKKIEELSANQKKFDGK